MRRDASEGGGCVAGVGGWGAGGEGGEGMGVWGYGGMTLFRRF